MQNYGEKEEELFNNTESEDENSPASHVYKELSLEELEILNVSKRLKRADRRSFKIETVFTNPSTNGLKNSIVNFIVGSCIRRTQQKQSGNKEEHYSFVIHTDIHRASQNWQEELVNKLNEELIKIAREDQILFNQLVKEAYEDFKLSGVNLPEFNTVLQNVSDALIDGMLIVEKVNSDKDVKALLDSKGQLTLRTPLNIFIGGQILDRGITIKNMIGFYYGRNPKKFQQDTVLQHSRMYGHRSKEDLTVTRFYTTRGIYEVMRRIHESDDALREAFRNGSHENGVYFIQTDISGRLVPCSPNKIMRSNITTLKPYKKLFPSGFQTGSKSSIKRDIEELDKEIFDLQNASLSDHFMIPLAQALDWLNKIKKTFAHEEKGYEWDINTHKAYLEHLSKNFSHEAQRGKVWIVVRTNSDISRMRPDGRFFDNTGGDTGETAFTVAKKIAEDIPALMLIRQNGKEELGWRGSPFWLPVIVAPKNTRTAIFDSDIASYNHSN